MDRPAIVPIQSGQDQSDSEEPHAKRQAQRLTWTNRRTRVTQACDRCRERKRQCDYLLPRCGRCQKVNKDCTFFAVQKTRGRPLGSSNSSKGTPAPSSQATDTSSNSSRSGRRRSSDDSMAMALRSRSDISVQQDRQGPSSVSTQRAAGLAGAAALDRSDHRVNITSASSSASHYFLLPTSYRDNPFSTPITPSLPPLPSSRVSQLSSSIPTTKTGISARTTTPAPSSPSSSSSFLPTTLTTTTVYPKEVIDHLISVFFEYSYYYFNFFDPVTFLQEYEQGVADPYLVDAMCATAARFSTHPAVLKTPPYLSGEPFAVRVRLALSRQVISEVTISHLHTALLLSFYEYSAGRSLQGYHFGGMALRMAPELQLDSSLPRTQQGEENEDRVQYSEDEDDHDSRDHNYIDTHISEHSRHAQSIRQSPHPLPLLQQEARTADQVRTRTFFFLSIMDIVAAFMSGLPPAIDAHQYQLPEPPMGDKEWWMSTDRRRRRSSASTSMRRSPTTLPAPTPIPGLSSASVHTRLSKTTRISSSSMTTPTNTITNPRLSSRTNRTPHPSSPTASASATASYHSPRVAHSARQPRPSISPLSPSLSFSSHLNSLPTPPTHLPLLASSPLQSHLPHLLSIIPTTAATPNTPTTATTPTTTTPIAGTSPSTPTSIDGPLLSTFSQSILRILSRPQLIIGREPFEHYRTLIPIIAAVMRFTNHACASETNSTMMSTSGNAASLSSSFRNKAQPTTHTTTTNTDTNALFQPAANTLIKSSAYILSKGSGSSSSSNTNNNSSKSERATSVLSSPSSHHAKRNPSHPPNRSSKRRRANPIFTSKERKVQFKRADQDLEQWADQLPEAYRPMNAVARFHQFETNSINLSVLYYLIVMVLHRPIMINASLAANRRREGIGGGVGHGGRGGGGGGSEGDIATGATTTVRAGGIVEAVKTRTVRDHARDDDFKDGSAVDEADNVIRRIDDVEMETSAHLYSAEEEDEDECEQEETGNEVDMEGPIDGNDYGNQTKDNVRRKLKGRKGEKERVKSDYDSDDAEDLQITERSAQRCIEAANTVIAIVGSFDDTQIKYHGGHYTSTIYLAGTILIMQLSKTEDPAVKNQIHEQLQACFQFFSILSPFWQETDEKAKTLRDLLSSQAEQQGDPSTEGGDGGDGDDQDKDDEDGDDYSGGADEYDDQEGDDGGADDDGGAEQSLHDLMIADALLDLSNSNRPHGQDYSWGGESSSFPPSSSPLSQAVKCSSSSSSLPSLSLLEPQPPSTPRFSQSPPSLRLSPSGSSLSEYHRLSAAERQLLEQSLGFPLSNTAPSTTGVTERNVLPHRHHPSLQLSTLPQQQTNIHLSNQFDTHNTINSVSLSKSTIYSPTTLTTATTGPTGFTDRASGRSREEDVGTGGTGGTRRHTVSTGGKGGVSITTTTAFLPKRDKILFRALSLPPPPPPLPTLHQHHHYHHHHHHHHHQHRQTTTTWIRSGVYPELNNPEETTLISLEKLCLSIETPFS